MNYYFARGSFSSGGSRSSFSSSRSYSSSSSRSSSYSRSSSSKSSSTSKSVRSGSTSYGKSTAKPGSTIRSGTSTIKTSANRPVNSRYSRSTGVIGSNGYTQHFYGYSAPAGSVVYYPQHSFFDYLPWIYLFSSNSPHSDQATVVQPNGTQVVAQPAKSVDGMYIFNWLLLILIVVAAFAGIVYGVDKHFKKKELQTNEAN